VRALCPSLLLCQPFALRPFSSLRILLRRPPASPPFPYTTLFRSSFSAAAQSRSCCGSDTAERGTDGAVQRRAGSSSSSAAWSARSEEHTSELQSRFDLVCRLLLEKKKRVHCDATHCCSA